MFPHIPIKYDALWLNKTTLSIFLIIIFVSMYFVTNGSRKCENVCEEKGFAGSRYKPPGKYSRGSGACYCFTDEEMKLKNRIPPGVKVSLQ